MNKKNVIPTDHREWRNLTQVKRDPSTSLGMTLLIIIGFIVAMTVVIPAHALTVDTKLENPRDEARAQKLFHGLRCVVCQSEAISDSPAQVASDIRKHVREQIAAGKSDDAIKDYLVEQYGERVLMRPKLNERNALLWFGPLVILLAGGFFAWRTLFRGQA